MQGALGAVGEGQGLRTVFISEGVKPFRYLVHSQIPANLLPLPGPPFACPFERVIDPVGMV